MDLGGLDRLRGLSFLEAVGQAQFSAQVRCTGIGLSMRCIVNAQDIACIRYQSMLKAPSSADERHPLFTGELDGAERPAHAFVGAARAAPEGVTLPLRRFTGIAIQRLCRQPDAVQRHRQGAGRMIQGVVGRRVREAIRIMVSYHSASDRFGRQIHARLSIIAERHVAPWRSLRKTWPTSSSSHVVP